MPRAEKIRAQTTPEDGVLLETGFQNSIFHPRSHVAFSDSVREKVNQNVPDQLSGRKIIFDIEKQATLLEDVNLNLTLPALAIPGDGTYIRYQNYPLWSLFEKVVIKCFIFPNEIPGR